MRPEEIEKLSFELIDEQAGNKTADKLGLSEAQYTIARRMVHTTGDFDYFTNVRFHPDAITAGIKAINSGRPIIADTNMLAAGATRLPHDTKVIVRVNDDDIKTEAAGLGITRSILAMRKSADIMNEAIIAIGNAPTALLEVIRLIEENKVSPALVIGIPVGFVKAAESKDDLSKINTPHITCIGPKGGSAVAATTINALAIMAAKE